MLTVLAQGVRIIMYEGSPLYPDVKKFLKFIDEQKYTYSQPRMLYQLMSVSQR
jgi:acyl-coenzyme A synthetase/AMP-(fatty) acid ligase